ncbi:sodium:solute symporter family protein [candidate division KSB1 bacterium]|nr:sodium:solute symporter family protein [candidate division KSB1 bacterium]
MGELETVFKTNFGTIDWIIVFVYICIPVVIGIWVRKYITQLSDFLVAGRSLRLFLAIATMTGTELGLVTVMYNSELGFKHGFSAFHVGVIEAICVLAIGLTGFIVYKLRQMEIMTIPEFYERRFGKRTRIIGGTILALGGILNMGLFLQAGARFMMGVTGYANAAGAKVFMSVMLIMVLIYTVYGGMISVVLNDFLQFVVLSIGMIVGSYFAISAIGWDKLFEIPKAVNNQSWFSPVAEGSDFGSIYVLFMVIVSLSAAALWQSGTIRALSAKSPKIAKQLYAWSSISYLARRIIPMLWGICAFIFFSHMLIPSTEKAVIGVFQGAEPLKSPQYGMPIFIGKVIGTGWLGLLAAGMFAAFMSTHDSYLLCWSSVITQDIVSPLRKKGLSDKKRILITRISIVVIGLFLLIWGLWFEAPVSLWNYMAVTGTIYLAGAFTVVVAGLYWKKASSTGAIIALFAGLIAVLGIGPWTNIDKAFKLDEKSFISLNAKGAPPEIVNKLKELENEIILGKENFIEAIESRIGKEQAPTYDSLIIACAKQGIRYSITEQSMLDLKSKKLPDNIIQKLAPIQNKIFVGKENFIENINILMDKNEHPRYRSSIILCAADRVPWYLTDKFIGVATFFIAFAGMIFGSLLFPDKNKSAEARS